MQTLVLGSSMHCKLDMRHEILCSQLANASMATHLPTRRGRKIADADDLRVMITKLQGMHDCWTLTGMCIKEKNSLCCLGCHAVTQHSSPERPSMDSSTKHQFPG